MTNGERSMGPHKRHEQLAQVCASYLAAIQQEAWQKSETVVAALDLADIAAHDVARDLASGRAGSGDPYLSQALAEASQKDFKEPVVIFTDASRSEMRAVLVKNGLTRVAKHLSIATACDGWFVTMTDGRTRVGMVPLSSPSEALP